jgi:hypothetical protein
LQGRACRRRSGSRAYCRGLIGHGGAHGRPRPLLFSLGHVVASAHGRRWSTHQGGPPAVRGQLPTLVPCCGAGGFGEPNRLRHKSLQLRDGIGQLNSRKKFSKFALCPERRGDEKSFNTLSRCMFLAEDKKSRFIARPCAYGHFRRPGGHPKWPDRVGFFQAGITNA